MMIILPVRGMYASKTVHPCMDRLIAFTPTGAIYETELNSKNISTKWRIVGHTHYQYDKNNGVITCIAGRYLWCVDQWMQSAECWNLRTGVHRWRVLREFHTEEGIEEINNAWGLSNGDILLALEHGVISLDPVSIHATRRLVLHYHQKSERLYFGIKHLP